MKKNPSARTKAEKNESAAVRGTFGDLLDGVDAPVAAIARRLRAMILEVEPGAVETVRPGDNAATYGVGPQKMKDGCAYVMPLRGSVNLGFYQGASLADADGALEGTGKALRHVKVRSIADADRSALRKLVKAAFALRRSGMI